MKQLVRFGKDLVKTAYRMVPNRLSYPVLVDLQDFKMYVRRFDYTVGGYIAHYRSYEPHVTAAIRPFLASGSVFVDIGANLGYYTFLAARLVGASGKVIAFEPGVDNCALIERSIAVNGFHNVILHPYAVADREQMLTFRFDGSNGNVVNSGSNSSCVTVKAIVLDDCLSIEQRIDVIKIDIEGAEVLALQGMRGIIARHKPIIFTEFFPRLMRDFDVDPVIYLGKLRELGYELLVVHREQGLLQAPQTNEYIMNYCAERGVALGKDKAYVDLIATPHGQQC